MAWKEKKFTNVATSIPLSRGFVKATEMSSFVNKRIRDSQYDYHETEAFEVTEVILNQPLNRASVKGTFVNNPNQPIKGDVVKPKNPNIVAVPVVGEQVDVIELNGQHFYTSTVNLKGSVNENSIPGASGGYVKNTKYGEKFERKNTKPLEIGEGCVLFEGRFGQSIHFGSDKQKPQIKIVAGHRGTTENIDKDDSSIHLLGAFGNADTEDKKILIKSNGIFITGTNNIRLNSEKVELGSGANQSVVRGDDLKALLDQVFEVQIIINEATMALKTAEASAKLAAAGGTPTQETIDIGKEIVELKKQNVMLEDAIANSTYLSDTVKTA